MDPFAKEPPTKRPRKHIASISTVSTEDNQRSVTSGGHDGTTNTHPNGDDYPISTNNSLNISNTMGSSIRTTAPKPLTQKKGRASTRDVNDARAASVILDGAKVTTLRQSGTTETRTMIPTTQPDVRTSGSLPRTDSIISAQTSHLIRTHHDATEDNQIQGISHGTLSIEGNQPDKFNSVESLPSQNKNIVERKDSHDDMHNEDANEGVEFMTEKEEGEVDILDTDGEEAEKEEWNEVGRSRNEEELEEGEVQLSDDELGHDDDDGDEIGDVEGRGSQGRRDKVVDTYSDVDTMGDRDGDNGEMVGLENITTKDDAIMSTRSGGRGTQADQPGTRMGKEGKGKNKGKKRDQGQGHGPQGREGETSNTPTKPLSKAERRRIRGQEIRAAQKAKAEAAEARKRMAEAVGKAPKICTFYNSSTVCDCNASLFLFDIAHTISILLNFTFIVSHLYPLVPVLHHLTQEPAYLRFPFFSFPIDPGVSKCSMSIYSSRRIRGLTRAMQIPY